MLLTITTTHNPASDLSFLLHKHPGRTQQVETSGGVAHIFYPEVSDARCTAALLLDIDPVGLVRRDGGSSGNDFALQQYVNDRPYVASSFMSAAIAKAFSSALNGSCKTRPELLSVQMPFEVRLPVLPVRGGLPLLEQLFAPLGYSIKAQRLQLDEQFPDWGESRYFDVTLRHTLTLQTLLSHLYILIPVCDNDKHYWIGKHEVDKLMEKGGAWLDKHPAREVIASRYLKNQKGLISDALQLLLQDETAEVEAIAEAATPKLRAHDERLLQVKNELLATGAKRIGDLGCGEGKLLKLLMAETQFAFILGMDVSYRSLEIAQRKLKPDRQHHPDRVQLVQGALTYRDSRLHNLDAVALVEVIEHLDEPRLSALEKVVFAYARPGHVIVTTPNAEYNVLFETLSEGTMRHSDHRFEWTRAQFQAWGNALAATYGYTVSYKSIGEEKENIGALTQMAIFKRST